MGEKLDRAFDLIQRLPPQKVERALKNLIDLIPDLSEDLLSTVNHPLRIASDKLAGKEYLLSDYNRFEDSYRSPWTNTYEPEVSEAIFPSPKLRELEIEANSAFTQYREMYYDGGISSVYLWESEGVNGFSGAVLIKRLVDQSTGLKGCWDSIHVFEVEEKGPKQDSHYKLTSSFIVWLRSNKTLSGSVNIAGGLTRQSEKYSDFKEHGSHLGNIGSMIEEMENRVWNFFTSVCMGKTNHIVNCVRMGKAAAKQIGAEDLFAGSSLFKRQSEAHNRDIKPKPKPKVPPIPANRIRVSKQKSESLEPLDDRQKLLEKEISELKAKIEEYLEIQRNNHERLASINESIQKILEEQSESSKKSGQNFGDEQEERVILTRDLERLKREKNLFYQNCKKEKKRLQKEIEAMSIESEKPQEDEENLAALETELEEENERLRRVKLELAEKSKEVARLQRTLDDIPSRAELNQYQKRLVELYNQVAFKHFETKKFYILYNQLEDTRIHLNKELSLLDSILSNFNLAMVSSQTKDQFLNQFEQIVENIKQAEIKVEKIQQSEKMRKDHLNETYLDLVEKQRTYCKAVRELKEEMRKNEVLTSK